MKTYFFMFTSSDGENFDLLVHANNVQDAVGFWHDHFADGLEDSDIDWVEAASGRILATSIEDDPDVSENCILDFSNINAWYLPGVMQWQTMTVAAWLKEI